MARNNVPLSVMNQRKAEVLSKVSIPMYFYNVIVPQLGDYYSLYPVDFDNKPVVCCPLHDEDTPSCRYYPETESFYCFGCQKGGNVINLHKYFFERMNGHSIDTETAIMFLFNFFIKNNSTLPVLERQKQTIDQPIQKSTDIDMIRYNRYADTLESTLKVDNSISQDSKEIIWHEMDNMSLLLSINEIGAVDALQHIKSVVKNNIK